MEARMLSRVDAEELRDMVQTMYRQVAEEPQGPFHFELGRSLAEKLGYLPEELDRIPSASVESFAGVGYYFALAKLQPGEAVLDLGCGSGMDSFVAALKVGPSGTVIGIDLTEAQLRKAVRLAAEGRFNNASFRKGYIEELPVEDGSIDVVISNGVINLCPDKAQVFREIARVLRPGGRMAISDIVTEKELPEGITCNATLWAACIGGASQQDQYREAIEGVGLRVTSVLEHPQYGFISKSAQGASQKYGVKSVSYLAEKTGA